MDDTPKTGVSVEQASSPRRTTVIGWAILAIAAQVALVDAVIETFRSGSTIRWWVTGSVLVFVAQSVWFWRPGGTLAKRWGWPGAAQWSVAGLLVLLAVTAWLPEGQVNGVRMALQPTSTVLTAAIALAVLLAAYVLVRGLGFLPKTARLVARGVVILLAIYALAALGMAIRDQATFASLFQGGAVWQRLPNWLQGTFVGALGLLPLAILAQITRFAETLRRKEPVRLLVHQTTALVMALVMALSNVILLPRQHQEPVSTVSLAGLAELAERQRAEIAGLLGITAQSSPLTKPEFDRRWTALTMAVQETVNRLDRTSYDPAAVIAQVGRDAKGLFQWVRDNTQLVPYSGVLRGPTGVLMDKVGNSLDRSLLLVSLLQASGSKARLAHAKLSSGQTSELLRRWSSIAVARRQAARNPVEVVKPVIDAYSKTLGLPSADLLSRYGVVQAAAAEVRRATVNRTDEQSRSVAAAVSASARTRSNDEQAASDHWWAQLQDGADWLDLDPALPAGSLGDRVLPAAETLAGNKLPPSLYHEVRIKVVIEQTTPTKRQERVVLARTIRPSELFGVPVSISNLPLTSAMPRRLNPEKDPLEGLIRAAEAEKEWVPVLQVGAEFYTDKAFSVHGSIEPLNTAVKRGGPLLPNPVGEVVGLLGGAEDRQTGGDGEGQLSAEWIDYEIHVPGQQARTVRRELFDEIGPGSRADANPQRHPLAESEVRDRAISLLSYTEILPIVCHLPSSYVFWLKAKALLANAPIFKTFLEQKDRLGNAVEVLTKASPIPGPLYDLAVMRHTLNPTGGDSYLAEPNIFSSHAGLSRDGTGSVGVYQAFDIVANRVSVLDAPSLDPFTVRLRQGVYDTNAEAFTLEATACCGQWAKGVSGAAAAYEASLRSGAVWVRIDSKNQLPTLSVPDDVRARMAADLESGLLIVAPREAGGDAAWWRVDPVSGETLGVGTRGWGSATTEYSFLTALKELMHNVVFQFGVKVVLLGFCMFAALIPAPHGTPKEIAEERDVGALFCIAGAVFGMPAIFATLAGDAYLATVLFINGLFWELMGMALEVQKFRAYHPKLVR